MRGFACVLLVLAALGGATPDPRLDDYRCAVDSHLPVVRPILVTHSHRRFRTVIRAEARRDVDFAGHYVVVEWGCGSGCSQMAIVDRLSGTVYDGPLGDSGRSYFEVGGNPDEDNTGIFFQRDSALMILRGCPESRRSGTYYFQWTGTRFRLLRRVPMDPPVGCDS